MDNLTPFTGVQLVASGLNQNEFITQNTYSLNDNQSSFGFGGGNDLDEDILELTCEMIGAYMRDGMCKSIVDKHVERLTQVDLEGDPKLVMLLERRLNDMSLKRNQHWKDLINNIALHLCVTGSAPIFKYKGSVSSDIPIRRPVHFYKPYPIAGYELVSIDSLELAKSKNNGSAAFAFKDAPKSNRRDPLILDGKTKLDSIDALLKPPTNVTQDNVFICGQDYSLITLNRPPGATLGMGLIAAGLEDLKLLRAIESTTATMIKKYSMPLIWDKITRRTSQLGGGYQNDMIQTREAFKHASPEGIIITPENHEIKTLGSESKAIRAEGYLEAFAARAAASLGGSLELIGMRGSNAGTTDYIQQKLLATCRNIAQVIATGFEYYILWELLWELGYDPYKNPAHRVYLVFGGLDESEVIKRQTHAADLFVKNVIDIDQFKLIANGNYKKFEDSKINLAKTYSALHQIPVIKAKSVPQTATERKHLESLVPSILPDNREEIADFLTTIHKLYYLTEEEFTYYGQVISSLIHDKEAIQEFVLTQLRNET